MFLNSARTIFSHGGVRTAGLGLVVAGVIAAPAWGNINLELRPNVTAIAPGGAVNFGLYAVSDNAFNQSLAAAQVILTWNVGQLNLLGLSNVGAVPLLSSSFGAEPFGLNTSLTDGDAMWLGFAPLGVPVQATPPGALLTTVLFQAPANAPLGLTHVNIPLSAGNPTGFTTVFDGTVPNLNVTGTLTGASIVIVPAPGIGAAVLMLGAMRAARRRRD